jgi:hypothetical protein
MIFSEIVGSFFGEGIVCHFVMEIRELKVSDIFYATWSFYLCSGGGGAGRRMGIPAGAQLLQPSRPGEFYILV